MTRTGPLPLRSEPGIHRELVLALSPNDAELPTSAQLSALRARLPGNTRASAASDHVSPRLYAKPSKRFRAAVIFACLLVAAVAAAASYWVVKRKQANRSQPIVATPLPHVVNRGPSAASTPPAPEVSAQAPAMEVDASTPPSPVPPKAVAEGPSELELLHEARRLEASDPAAALRVVARHIQLFPRGILAQERELVAIEALVRLGRTTEARARGEAFLRLYPGSVHARQVQKLIGVSASETGTPPADPRLIDTAPRHQEIY